MAYTEASWAFQRSHLGSDGRPAGRGGHRIALRRSAGCVAESLTGRCEAFLEAAAQRPAGMRHWRRSRRRKNASAATRRPMTTHQLTGSEWHDGARVRAVWKSYPVRHETRYSTTYSTSARRSRSSSHRLQAR